FRLRGARAASTSLPQPQFGLYLSPFRLPPDRSLTGPAFNRPHESHCHGVAPRSTVGSPPHLPPPVAVQWQPGLVQSQPSFLPQRSRCFLLHTWLGLRDSASEASCNHPTIA